MALPFDTKPAPGTLYRIGRKDTVWQWIDPKTSGGGSRWDCPDGSYAVLYASTSPLAAYLEKLSALRPDLDTVERVTTVKPASPDPKDPPLRVGELDSKWRGRYMLATGTPTGLPGPFVAVAGARSLSTLLIELAHVAHALKIRAIDAGVLRLDYSDEFVAFTKAISNFIFHQTDDSGAFYAGIFYLGQYGDDIENYALFERCTVIPTGHSEIAEDDPYFLQACELLSLKPA